ncbi:DUF29 family protein [Anabaena cylindrica UHCC 0172]|nr:DUF29 family protein [Anabaena cylindrica]MEA5554490.1 DUF29 family protein [Anabaena cylindrica UHCC 0172]
MRDVAKETHKSVETFPNECPFSIEQVLDPAFLV